MIVWDWDILIQDGLQWWDCLNVVMNYSCSYINRIP